MVIDVGMIYKIPLCFARISHLLKDMIFIPISCSLGAECGPEAKLVDYLLSLIHPEGRGEAIFFRI
jgi:hypothetical protein